MRLQSLPTCFVLHSFRLPSYSFLRALSLPRGSYQYSSIHAMTRLNEFRPHIPHAAIEPASDPVWSLSKTMRSRSTLPVHLDFDAKPNVRYGAFAFLYHATPPS